MISHTSTQPTRPHLQRLPKTEVTPSQTPTQEPPYLTTLEHYGLEPYQCPPDPPRITPSSPNLPSLGPQPDTISMERKPAPSPTAMGMNTSDHSGNGSTGVLSSPTSYTTHHPKLPHLTKLQAPTYQDLSGETYRPHPNTSTRLSVSYCIRDYRLDTLDMDLMPRVSPTPP